MEPPDYTPGDVIQLMWYLQFLFDQLLNPLTTVVGISVQH